MITRTIWHHRGMPTENAVQRAAREVREAHERRLADCREGRHMLGPVDPPSMVRSTYTRHCCVCHEHVTVDAATYGTIMPGTPMRFPPRIFGSMSRRQIRRMLGLPRNTVFLHSWQDNSTWIIVPPAAEADTTPETDDEDVDPEA